MDAISTFHTRIHAGNKNSSHNEGQGKNSGLKKEVLTIGPVVTARLTEAYSSKRAAESG